MHKIYIEMDKDNRSINVSYRIEEDENSIFYAILDIAKENKLNCVFGEDNFHLRHFYISGIKTEKVIKAYESIERLNI